MKLSCSGKLKFRLASSHQNRNIIRSESMLLLKQKLPITTLLSRSEKQPIAPNEQDLGKLLNGLEALQKIRKL